MQGCRPAAGTTRSWDFPVGADRWSALIHPLTPGALLPDQRSGAAGHCAWRLQLAQTAGAAIVAHFEQAQGIGRAVGFHMLAAGKHHAVAGLQQASLDQQADLPRAASRGVKPRLSKLIGNTSRISAICRRAPSWRVTANTGALARKRDR